MTVFPSERTSELTGAYSRDIALPGFRRTLWGPIMLGVVSAIGLQFIFTVLGMAIGVSAADPAVDESKVRTVSMAAGVWWLITGTIALFVGGLVAGRMSGLPRTVAIKISGAAMWAVVSLFGFAVIWTGAGMASAASSPIGIVSGSETRSYGRNYDRTNARPATLGTSETANTTSRDDALRDNTSRAEEVRQAAQTAAWWSVIGLLVGLGASVAGACIGAGIVTKETDVVVSRNPAIA